MRKRLSWLILCAGSFLYFAAAYGNASSELLQRSSYDQLPGWKNDTHQDSFAAFKNSCIALIHTHTFKPLCEKAYSLPTPISNSAATHFFETYFTPYQVNDPSTQSTQGLFTGYYAPSYSASRVPTTEFNTPIYGKPYHYATAIKNHSLPSRAEIAHHQVKDFAPILAYVRSRIDRFFLQIQGSGILSFPDGTSLLLGYAGENGYPYEPIGKDLIQMGEIPKKNISMQSIQGWLYAHPARVDEILNLDPSFVFFRALNFNEPIGAEGVPLTPRSSIAVDTAFTKLGTPVYISTYYPKISHETIVSGEPLRHLFIAQDVGGAIKNPIRADIFFGTGNHAEWLAGHMQSPGKMWVLLPKDQKNSPSRT
jgi:membrane-bound lytic murein transglycosylase A